MNSTLSKTMILITVIVMDILAGAELDLFVPSFPELQDKFSLTPFWVEALLSINFAGICLGLFFVGALADRYGRKPIIIYGLVIFIIGTLSCLFAPSYPFLLIGRFLQGIGISGPGTLCFLIIADLYSIKEQQFMMAMLNGVINATVGAAPVVGSYITLYFHWQGNFTALLIMGLISLVMTLVYVPKMKLPEHKETLSLKGYLPIFQSGPLFFLITCLTFLFAPYWIFVGTSSLLYIEDLGVSLAHFGYYQGVFCVVFALGSILFGLVIHRFDQRKMSIFSFYIFVTSLICLGLVTYFDTHQPILITLAFLVFVIGQIIPSVVLYPLALNYMPQAKGKISAILQGEKLIVTGLALQLAGYFYGGSFQNIGIILMTVISVGVICLFFVNRDKHILH